MTCDAWPIVWPCETATVDPDLLAAAQTAAQNLLWAMSGRRLGVCTHREVYWPPSSGACGIPYKDASGLWRNGGLGGPCCRILLAHRPIVDVSGVTEVGVALLPFGDYRWSSSYLRRVGACWPRAAECAEPPVEVTYTAGVPPVGVAAAMGEVACEYLTAFQGGVCKLPARATQVTRQGVTVQMAPADDFTNQGRLGLPLADAWLTTVNPTGLDRRSRVFSPDLARGEAVAGAPGQSDQVVFAWVEADPVAKVLIAHGAVAKGWLGTYQAQIRSGPESTAPLVGAFTVATQAVGPDVRFDFTLDTAASADISAGTYWWDAQQTDGPTRLSGVASVSEQITVSV